MSSFLVDSLLCTCHLWKHCNQQKNIRIKIRADEISGAGIEEEKEEKEVEKEVETYFKYHQEDKEKEWNNGFIRSVVENSEISIK